MSDQHEQSLLTFDNLMTAFVQFVGTLNQGSELTRTDGSVSLHSGNSSFENAPFLPALLEP
jgi:hypothetical protein